MFIRNYVYTLNYLVQLTVTAEFFAVPWNKRTTVKSLQTHRLLSVRYIYDTEVNYKKEFNP